MFYFVVAKLQSHIGKSDKEFWSLTAREKNKTKKHEAEKQEKRVISIAEDTENKFDPCWVTCW